MREDETAVTSLERPGLGDGPTQPAEVIGPGTKVGRYVIERAVGEGGMGVVFEASDRELQRKVAIKLLSPRTTSASPMWQERLLREARAMARVSHPNVVPIYDLGAHGQQVFIAMELVEGVTLRDWTMKQQAWPAVVDVFRQIGRGLAAAHAAGLVHRDVKPTNILIGRDGRARLTDFGVVKHSDDVIVEPRDRSAPSADGNELTRVGMLIGTIPYMAPEQLGNAAADRRTDQFSFCVAFYEALYGENPCAARDPFGLAGWRVPDAPAGTQVPAWLRKVVVRGLSADPEQRHPSMDALLGELRRDRPSRVLPVAIGGVLVVGAIAVVVAKVRAPACEVDTSALAGVWDDAAKRTIRSAFRATGKPYADASYATVVRTLDAYTQSWLALQQQTCERGDADAAARDCLAWRLDDLRAQTDQLAHADGRTVELAVAAATSLPDPGECLHARPLPVDLPTQARVRALRKRLSIAKAMEDVGKYADGVVAARDVVAQARGIGDRALESEALLQLGELQRRAGKYAEAADTLDEAIRASVASRHDVVAARAWMMLALVVGVDQARYADGEKLALHARASIERLGGDPRLEALLAGDVSILYRRQGKYAESLAQTDRALALGEPIFGPAHPQVAQWLNSSGLTLLDSGNHAEARLRFTRALAIWETEFGEHPKVGTVLGNMALERFRSGDYTQAATMGKRALAITEAAVGRDNPSVVPQLLLVGSALGKIEQHAEAMQMLERALALTKPLPEQHTNRLAAEVSLGIVYFDAGAPAKALPLLEHAEHVLATKVATADPSDLAETRFALAKTLAVLGERHRAHEVAQQARDGYAAAGPKAKPKLAEVDVWLDNH